MPEGRFERKKARERLKRRQESQGFAELLEVRACVRVESSVCGWEGGTGCPAHTHEHPSRRS
jgi:hypothetical protein